MWEKVGDKIKKTGKNRPNKVSAVMEGCDGGCLFVCGFGD